MTQNYKIKDLLKNLSFYRSEIKKSKQKRKNFTNNRFSSELPFFPKKVKNLTNYQLSRELSFFPKRSKRRKRLTKHQILTNVLPCYDSVGILRKQHALRGYAETYEVEFVDKISLADSLFLAKSSIINLFLDLLQEKRGFKYVLLAVITLKRWSNAINKFDIETIYIRSEPVTVTDQRFNLSTSYKKLKNILNIWAGQGSGWIVDKIENIWINISNYDPLSGSSYIPLPPELNNPKKGLINIKNKDTECFKWCYIRFINPTNSHRERINKQDKKIASTLDYRGINFPMKACDYEIVAKRFNINVNILGYQNKIVPLYVSKKSNEKVLNVLLISNEEKSNYVFIKDFSKLMYSEVKTINQHKKNFCMSCLQNFTTKEILNKHRERCLLINDTQAVRYETGEIKFENNEKQIPIPFKIYADTECVLKRINTDEGKCTKLYQKHIPNSIGAKLVCIDNKFTLPTIIF